MRPLVLLALAGLSLVVLAGISLSGGSDTQAQSTTIIEVGDLWFCDPSFQGGVCETNVQEGDTVQWQWVGSQPHTTTECAGDLNACPTPHLWDSEVQTIGTFSFTFEAAGTFVYRCQVHPNEMRGQITVLPAGPSPSPQPSPQPSSEPSPSPSAQASPVAVTPTPAGAQPAVIPAGGGEPPLGGDPLSPWWAAVAAGGLLLASAVILGLRGLRR